MTNLLEATDTEPLIGLNEAWSKVVASHAKAEAASSSEGEAEIQYRRSLEPLAGQTVKFTGLNYRGVTATEGKLSHPGPDSRELRIGGMGIPTELTADTEMRVATTTKSGQGWRRAPRKCSQAIKGLARAQMATGVARTAWEAAKFEWETPLAEAQCLRELEITNLLSKLDTAPFTARGVIVAVTQHDINLGVWLQVKLIDPPMTVEVRLTADSRISRIITPGVASAI